MESVGYIFGLVSFVMCMQLSSRISKLERLTKQAGIGTKERESLKEIVEKNIGKTCKIIFDKDEINTGLDQNKYLLMDADEEWVFLKMEKKKSMQLIRISAIKNIQFLA